MHRYINTENFRAPIDSNTMSLQGNWPDVHSYVDVSQYRQPYRAGYYQDNTLMGLGVDPVIIDSPITTTGFRSDLDAMPSWAIAIGSMAIGFSLAALLFRKG